MNKLIIYQYINRIRKEDIVNYCNIHGININYDDLDVIYNYIKNDYKRFFDNPINILNEIKYKVSDYTYNEIMQLYDKYKNLI